MNLNAFIAKHQKSAAWGAALTVILGWLMDGTRAGEWFLEKSYDIPTVFTSTESQAFNQIQLVEMDEASHAELHQEYRAWDLRLHARLLDYLRRDGADLVAFDIVFLNPATNAAALNEFTEAIRAHGRVVLAAGSERIGGRGIRGRRVIPPIDELRDATPHWGPPSAEPGEDLVVRQIHPGTEQRPALVRVAASLTGSPDPWATTGPILGPWVRYYGPGGTLPRISYFEATNQPTGFYRGKTVFIGGRPLTAWVTDEVDEFASPWKQRGFPLISGLELTATEFLNLAHRDFLVSLSPAGELGLISVFGLVLGAGLACARPTLAVILAFVGLVATTTGAFVLFFGSSLIFNWCLVVGVQIPVALGFSLFRHWRELKREKEWMDAPLADLWDEPPSKPASPTLPKDHKVPADAPATLAGVLPIIPDHQMIRPVGRGAYGDVWLARDALGSFHAVKIVRREAFDHADPYEREFRGLQKFTPISRAHPGLVHVLHVGRNESTQCFYYVMEAGDDERTGTQIDPATYTPRNLGRELRRRAPLALSECIELSTALCDALEFLHQQGLIHRDIKPANIIFVNYRPKLADIGLVTEIGRTHGQASNVGTDGYLPPEGPGTIAGDIYAMGKVLQDMTQTRRSEANGPTAVADLTEQTGSDYDILQVIINRATASFPEERYASAQAMRQALLEIKL